jgi:hypothetical protein
MPVHFGNSEDALKKILDHLEPAGPIVELSKEPAPGLMDWRERLRTTEEELQRLSAVYPFTWHGHD